MSDRLADTVQRVATEYAALVSSVERDFHLTRLQAGSLIAQVSRFFDKGADTDRARIAALEEALRDGIACVEKYGALLEGRILGATVIGQHGLSTRDAQFFVDKARALLPDTASESGNVK